MLKKGNRVMFSSCPKLSEPIEYVVRCDEYTASSGEQVVFLEEFSGSVSASFCKIITKGKRSGMDFKDSVHTTKIFKCGDETIQEDKISFGKDVLGGPIYFTNTSRTLTISGDYGNWVFCRPFIPSSRELDVSDPYWGEKLRLLSTQSAGVYSEEQAMEDIQAEIDHLVRTEDEDSEDLSEEKKWWEELKRHTESETEFLYHAHYEGDRPHGIESEDIPNGKKGHVWYMIILDSFEEICRKVSLKENTDEKKI